MATEVRRQMSGKRYPEEFKLAAVRQITEKGSSSRLSYS
jgi:transposase